MRSIWTGMLGFGLVNIPVRLYSGTESKAGISFNLLHEKDMAPIRYAKVCSAEEEEVTLDEIVKGYEYRKDHYVAMSDEDLALAKAKKAGSIDIFSFVKEDEVDPGFFEKPYYLEPDRGGDRPYVLLWNALKKSRKVAVARFVMRNRERLGIVRPHKSGALILNQMRFANEIREPTELKIPEAEVESKEVDLALALIDQLSGKFTPEEYHDTYTEKLTRIIEEKISGITPEEEEAVPQPARLYDLMSALKASLEMEGGETEGEKAKGKKRRKAS